MHTTIDSSPVQIIAESLHRAGIGIAGIQPEAAKWRMGVHRDDRILFLDAQGRSSRKQNEFSGDYLQAYREAIRRMKAWVSLSGCVDYTIHLDPVWDAESPAAIAPP